MKKKELTQILSTVNPRLFSFAFALVPDDLQAQQIVIDALTLSAVTEKDKEQLLKLVHFQGHPQNTRDLNHRIASYEKVLFKNVYRLGQKRFVQLEEGMSFEREQSEQKEFWPFYQLDLKERAVLHLKDKTDLTLKDISFVLQVNEEEVLKRLNSGRHNLLTILQYKQDMSVSLI